MKLQKISKRKCYWIFNHILFVNIRIRRIRRRKDMKWKPTHLNSEGFSKILVDLKVDGVTEISILVCLSRMTISSPQQQRWWQEMMSSFIFYHLHLLTYWPADKQTLNIFTALGWSVFPSSRKSLWRFRKHLQVFLVVMYVTHQRRELGFGVWHQFCVTDSWGSDQEPACCWWRSRSLLERLPIKSTAASALKQTLKEFMPVEAKCFW